MTDTELDGGQLARATDDPAAGAGGLGDPRIVLARAAADRERRRISTGRMTALVALVALVGALAAWLLAGAPDPVAAVGRPLALVGIALWLVLLAVTAAAIRHTR